MQRRRNPCITINDRATTTSSLLQQQTPDVRKQRDLRGCCAPALSTRSLPEEAPPINPTQLVNAHVAAAGSVPLPAD